MPSPDTRSIALSVGRLGEYTPIICLLPLRFIPKGPKANSNRFPFEVAGRIALMKNGEFPLTTVNSAIV